MGEQYRWDMSDYSPPQRDIAFVLDHVVPLEELTKLEPYQQIDGDSVYGVLDEFGRLMADVWAPTNVVGDTTGSHIDGDEVVFDDVFARSVRLQLGEGVTLRVPALDDLIQTKRWSARDKDLADLRLLEALRGERK